MEKLKKLQGTHPYDKIFEPPPPPDNDSIIDGLSECSDTFTAEEGGIVELPNPLGNI